MKRNCRNYAIYIGRMKLSDTNISILVQLESFCYLRTLRQTRNSDSEIKIARLFQAFALWKSFSFVNITGKTLMADFWRTLLSYFNEISTNRVLLSSNECIFYLHNSEFFRVLDMEIFEKAIMSRAIFLFSLKNWRVKKGEVFKVSCECRLNPNHISNNIGSVFYFLNIDQFNVSAARYCAASFGPLYWTHT